MLVLVAYLSLGAISPYKNNSILLIFYGNFNAITSILILFYLTRKVDDLFCLCFTFILNLFLSKLEHSTENSM